MKYKYTSSFLGIGKGFYLVIIFCALITISCGSSAERVSKNPAGNPSGKPDGDSTDTPDGNPSGTPDKGGGDKPDGNPTNTPEPLSEALSLACKDQQLIDLTGLLSWDTWNSSGITEVKCFYITPEEPEESESESQPTGIDWDNALSVDKLRDLASDSFEEPATDQVFLYLLKAGTYTPTIANGARDRPFTMRNRVAIIGGFSGNDFERSETTILSGEVGNLDDIDDNSYHVISNNDNSLDSSALLAHVTVSNGTANGSFDLNFGGGMYNNKASPTVTEVTFSNNKAKYGGGMVNQDSSPTLTEVTFLNNTASESGGGIYSYNSSPTFTAVTISGNMAKNGGGVFNDDSSPTFTAITFSNNSATDNGGGMYNNVSSPTLTAVTFLGNNATKGGGMTNESSSPTITEVTFLNNRASESGGGIYNNRSSPTLTAVTFSGNMAKDGGGMHNNKTSIKITASTFSDNTATQGGGAVFINSDGNGATTLVNSLLWGNKAVESGSQVANQVYMNTNGGGSEELIVRYSVLQGGVENGGVTHNTGNNGEREVYEESIEDGNPILSALKDNGGPVWTHAIAGPSAIDKGVKTGWNNDRKLCFSDGSVWLLAETRANTVDNTEATTCTGDITEVTTDARGYTHNGRPDIGAYEVGGTAPYDSP